ncbi:MAG: hypothetical protein R3C39_11510 [Dehalococcoidia bacterium]
MYGYEPPKPVRPGGCRDSLIIMRVAFEVLLPIVGVGIAALAVVAVAVVLFSYHPLLIFLPVAVVIGALMLVARRDRRLQAEERLRGEDGPRPPSAPR